MSAGTVAAESREHSPYCCPGETHSISRAMHLARLTSAYSACRLCPYRNEIALLSPRRARQLEQAPKVNPPLFHSEGASGVYLNQLGPAEATRLAQALGVHLGSAEAGNSRPDPPTVAIGNDGRPWTVELSAAVAHGLRWAGCRVVDIGPATSAVVAHAIDRLSADGGVLIGNFTGEPRHVSLSLFGFGALPFSSPGQLDAIQTLYHSPAPRPHRPYGALQHRAMLNDYLTPLEGAYHALRPLRIVVDTTSFALRKMLERLASRVALEIRFIAKGDGLTQLRHEVTGALAHFGAWIDGDGERCLLVDERGQQLPADSVAIVLSREFSDGIAPLLQSGAREQLHAQAANSRPMLLADPHGRIWFSQSPPAADALRTLTLLITQLSRSDRPLSALIAPEIK